MNVRSVLDKYGLRADKAFGQNFLTDENILRKIAEASGADKSSHVLEVGPGLGALTERLAQNAGFVTAVEADRRLLPALTDRFGDSENIRLVQGDILKQDLAELMVAPPGLTTRLCANLPYNITTPVIIKALESGLFSSVTVMVQKEVAERMAAAPGISDYGAFSVFTQYYSIPKRLFSVPPTCFFPPPKVTSAVIRLEVLKTPPVATDDTALFFRVVRAAFAQRRKTLLNALSGEFSALGKERIAAVLDVCGLPPQVRGETLELSQFAEVSNQIGAVLD
ncbi:MAG: 16S rRNA (adenine(1518)-N(6)/adenine(1519)-N(6))-dimethyltransferase RsmA [Oscillospiraceae bacterium]|nr:16S rRNA (adenine(1518)-N(6)/adenine(1519)-N(6))-dimethyltransferase RsmA [Oscillospiraceae bacterium]